MQRNNAPATINPMFGWALAILWLSGLYGVLETETLLAKALILVSLSPVSLALDHLFNRVLIQSKAYVRR